MPPALAASRRPSIPDVVAEHLEEHGFLSAQRRKLEFSVDVPTRRLGDLHERLEAHWDGLLVNRPESVELARERLAADDPWERASAIRFWLEVARPEFELIAGVFAETPPEHAPSWREALRDLSAGALENTFPPARRRALEPLPSALFVDALGWHRALTPEAISAAARHTDAVVRESLARHAGHAFEPDDAIAVLRPLLDDPDVGVRRRALWSLVLASPEAGLERARGLARGAETDPFAVRVLGWRGEPEDHARIAEAAATELGRPAAFHALADLGTPEAIETLIRLLAIPEPAHQAVVTQALETALGRIPRDPPDGPATPAAAAARWRDVSASLPRDARAVAGAAWPWRGDDMEEPGAFWWRSALGMRRRRNAVVWRPRVPDGFFEALPALDARPGE